MVIHTISAALATSGRSIPGTAARDDRLQAFPTAWVEPHRRGCCAILGSICSRNSHPLGFGEVSADNAELRLATNFPLPALSIDAMRLKSYWQGSGWKAARPQAPPDVAVVAAIGLPIAVIEDRSHCSPMTPVENPSNLARSVALVLLFPLSLILTAATNYTVGRLLRSVAPATDWIATAAIPSFALIAGLYSLLGDKRPLLLPPSATLARRSVAGLSMAWLSLWLGGCVVAAIITGRWLVYARGWPVIMAFLIFGPLGEELLFRGLIFSHARIIWPSSASAAIIVSTVAFSLHHVALQTAPCGLALVQLFFTIPMGIVFALLRERTGSLWPGLLVHVATNLPSTI